MRPQTLTVALGLLLPLAIAACASGTALPPQSADSAGSKLFNGYTKPDVQCFKCHNGDGSGANGPNLAERVPKLSDDAIIAAIDKGPSYMPSFKDKLSDDEKRAVVAWLRSRFGAQKLPAATTQFPHHDARADRRDTPSPCYSGLVRPAPALLALSFVAAACGTSSQSASPTSASGGTQSPAGGSPGIGGSSSGGVSTSGSAGITGSSGSAGRSGTSTAGAGGNSSGGVGTGGNPSAGNAGASDSAGNSGSTDSAGFAGSVDSGGSAGTGGSTTSNAGSSSAGASGYVIDLTQTSTSGLSSGAFMAVQFHVAFSSIMQGAAIFAGGPYSCAQGSATQAISGCEDAFFALDIAPLVALTKQYAAAGTIDDVSHLASQRVFLFGGAVDTVVSPYSMDALNSYYAAFLPQDAIQYVNRRAATGHTLPTTDYGNPCYESLSPWVGKCNYDGAGLALAQIYGTLAPRAQTLSAKVQTISQSALIANPAGHSLDDTGYVYVPAACTAGETCKIHVAFHGCGQGASAIGDAFYAHAGYNEWADSNHLIVLYPQVIASTSSPENPAGCWDWWGYDGADYAQQTAPQMAMARAMIKTFAGL